MKRSNAAGTVATLALTCIFGVTLLMGIFAGAAVYQRVGDRVDASAEERVGLTYITAKLHGFDNLVDGGGSAIRTGTFGGEDAIFLEETLDGLTYETILYVYDGQLREMLCLQGGEQEPEFGEVVSPAQSLKVESLKEGLLHLEYTGEGGESRSADVWLRSGGYQWGNG